MELCIGTRKRLESTGGITTDWTGTIYTKKNKKKRLVTITIGNLVCTWE